MTNRPQPLIGPRHSDSLFEQVRLICALMGTTDPEGLKEKADAIAYVRFVIDEIRSAIDGAEPQQAGNGLKTQIRNLDAAIDLIRGPSAKGSVP